MTKKKRNKLAYEAVKSDVILWAETYLSYEDAPLKLKDSQREFLRGNHPKTVVRAHRRSGKTLAEAVLATWYAETHPGSETLILCPDMSMVQALARYIDELLKDPNGVLSEINFSTTIPSVRRFVNGSSIWIKNTGSGSGGLSGYYPDLLIVEEAALVTEAVWPAINNIIDRKPDMTVYISGTPTTKPNIFWDIVKGKIFASINWKKVWYPVVANPDIDDQQKLDIRRQLDVATYQANWMATLHEEIVTPFTQTTTVQTIKNPHWVNDNIRIF